MDSDIVAPENPFAAPQQMLRERLNLLLTVLHPVVYADVVRAFQDEGKLLCQVPGDRPAGIWSLLTLLVAQHISLDIDPVYASSVAVAVESFASALDLLDDIEDEDQTSIVQELGAARVLNVSTILLTLAQQALLSLSDLGVDPANILSLLNTLQESTLGITSGQHQDILAETRSALDFTLEECIDIAAIKAGALLSLACRLGAQCAGADDALRERYAEFGKLLGIAAQLDNDCHDMYHLVQGKIPDELPEETGSASWSVKSDLIRSKKTLPVVLAAAEMAKMRGAAGANWENPLQGISELSDEEYLRALHEGILTTWGICLLYRERARDLFQEFEAQKPASPALRLLIGF